MSSPMRFLNVLDWSAADGMRFQTSLPHLQTNEGLGPSPSGFLWIDPKMLTLPYRSGKVWRSLNVSRASPEPDCASTLFSDVLTLYTYSTYRELSVRTGSCQYVQGAVSTYRELSVRRGSCQYVQGAVSMYRELSVCTERLISPNLCIMFLFLASNISPMSDDKAQSGVQCRGWARLYEPESPWPISAPVWKGPLVTEVMLALAIPITSSL